MSVASCHGCSFWYPLRRRAVWCVCVLAVRILSVSGSAFLLGGCGGTGRHAASRSLLYPPPNACSKTADRQSNTKGGNTQEYVGAHQLWTSSFKGSGVLESRPASPSIKLRPQKGTARSAARRDSPARWCEAGSPKSVGVCEADSRSGAISWRLAAQTGGRDGERARGGQQGSSWRVRARWAAARKRRGGRQHATKRKRRRRRRRPRTVNLRVAALVERHDAPRAVAARGGRELLAEEAVVRRGDLLLWRVQGGGARGQQDDGDCDVDDERRG